MVGFLRLVTLAVVATVIPHAAAVEAEASSGMAVAEKPDSPDASVPQGGDAVGDGSATAAKKLESLSVPESGGAIGYGCGYRGSIHRCWKFCEDGGRCWTYPELRCYDDSDCAGDPECSGNRCF